MHTAGTKGADIAATVSPHTAATNASHTPAAPSPRRLTPRIPPPPEKPRDPPPPPEPPRPPPASAIATEMVAARRATMATDATRPNFECEVEFLHCTAGTPITRGRFQVRSADAVTRRRSAPVTQD